LDKTPDEIIDIINDRFTNRDLKAMWDDGIDELVDDIMSSVKLAVVCSLQEILGPTFRHTIDAVAADVQNTIYDYYGNHYDLCAEPDDCERAADGAAPT
jgi:hypothetical protein